MANNNHVCKICGTEYSACNSCDTNKNWRSVVDTQRCWQLYTAVTQYRLGITKDDAFMSALTAAGVTKNSLDRQNIKDNVKELIREFYNKRGTQKNKITQQIIPDDIAVKAEQEVSAEPEDTKTE